MSKPQFFRPSDELRRRAVNFKTGMDIKLAPEEIAKLESVVHASRDSFIGKIADRLRDLRGATAAATADPTMRAVYLQRVRDNSYEVKGLGGTFGFSLLSFLAKSLNDYVEKRESAGDAQMLVISLHIDMLYLILAQRVMKVEPATNDELLETFHRLVKKFP